MIINKNTLSTIINIPLKCVPHKTMPCLHWTELLLRRCNKTGRMVLPLLVRTRRLMKSI